MLYQKMVNAAVSFNPRPLLLDDSPPNLWLIVYAVEYSARRATRNHADLMRLPFCFVPRYTSSTSYGGKVFHCDDVALLGGIGGFVVL